MQGANRDNRYRIIEWFEQVRGMLVLSWDGVPACLQLGDFLPGFPGILEPDVTRWGGGGPASLSSSLVARRTAWEGLAACSTAPSHAKRFHGSPNAQPHASGPTQPPQSAASL